MTKNFKIPLWQPALKQYDRITQGAKTRLFEEIFAEFIGAKFAVATTSGTVALFLALKACGVGSGDEVVIPDLTAVGTASAVRLAGAKVVLADVSREDFLIDVSKVPEDKPLIYVDFNGRVHTRLFGSERVVIEDACHALGSKGVGASKTQCYSFSPTKTIHTGQGGMVTTDDLYIYDQLLRLRNQGFWDVADFSKSEGYNFKFTDLQADVGLRYLESIHSILESKRVVYEWYREQLSDLEDVKLVETDLATTVPWLVDILVADYKTREGLVAHLEENGIGTRRFYPPLHVQPPFLQHGFPNAEWVSQRGLWLPSSVHLKAEDVAFVCDKIKEFFK